MAETIELTNKLVSFKTYHPNFSEKKQCLGFIKSQVKRDLYIQEFEFNDFPSLLLSTSKGNKYNLMLAGHIDVVRAPDEMFKVRQEGSKLFGRGVYDMKGNIAAMITALQQYSRSSHNGKKIGLLITSDEEIDGTNGTKAVLALSKLTADIALLPDNGINWNIMIAERGLMHIRTSDSNLQRELAKLFPENNPTEKWQTTFSVTSTIPQQVDIKLRFTTQVDKQIVLQLIKGKAHQIIRQHNVVKTPKNNRHVQQLAKIVNEQLQQLLVFGREASNRESDAIYFAEHKIPTALVRPIGGGEHRDEEWLSIEALDKFTQILHRVLN